MKLFKVKRKMLVMFCISIISISSTLNAQEAPPLTWHTFCGTANEWPEEKGKAIAYAGDNLYIAGFSTDTWDVYPAIINRPYTINGGRDGYVAKMSLDGNVEWLTYLGGAGGEECQDIVAGADGIYVCGYSGTWQNNLPPIIHNHYAGGVGPDAYVAKLSFEGVIEWLTFLGGSYEDYANGITLDENKGFLYVSGHSRLPWTVDDYQNNIINQHSDPSAYDAFAVKLDLDGDYVWHTFMGGSNGNGKGDYGSEIDVDASGNVYVGGSSTGTWGTPLTGFDHNGGDFDGFIAKLNSAGTRLWHMFIGTTSTLNKSDHCHDIAVDNAGNIYATGYTQGEWDAMEWGTPRVSYGWNEGDDIFVTKISTDGIPQWHTILGTGAGQQGNDIILMDNGDLFVACRDQNNWGDPVLPAQGGADLGIIKLDNDGYLKWHVMAGGATSDIGSGVCADDAGMIYATGWSVLGWSCVDLPLHPHAGNADPVNYGDYHTDVFVAKFDPASSVILITESVFNEVQGTTLTTTISLYDPCFILSELSASMGELVNNGDGTWTWTLDTEGMDAGNYDIDVTADGGEGYDPVSAIHVELTPANQLPVITIDQNTIYVDKGEIATNSGTITDPEGEPLKVGSYPGQLSFDDITGNWTWEWNTVSEPVGLRTITLAADDDNGNHGLMDYFDVYIKNSEERISSGLDWLTGQQNNEGGGDDGSWNGQSDCYVQNDAPVTITGFALAEFCSFAHKNEHMPFDDPSFEYYQQIIDGFDYLFSQAQSDGDGLGIYFNDPYPFENNYTTGAVMMAIASSRMASYLIDYPSNPVVHGKTFMQLMEEMVLYLQHSQQVNGSWNNDNYVVGNVAYGLICAERSGVEIPQDIKDKLSNWVDYIQDDESWGGVRFDPGTDVPDMINTAHLLVEMALLGEDLNVDRVLHAYEFLAEHWCNTQDDNMWLENYVELLFTLMKAFKLHSVEMSCDGENDWFTDLVNRVYTAPQSFEEGWWFCAWGASKELATCFALLCIEGDVPELTNQPPYIAPDNAEVNMDEGMTATNTGTVGDPDGDALTLTVSAGSVVNNGDGTWSWSYPANDGPADDQTITVTVDDGNGETASALFDLSVNNVIPEIEKIILPLEPVALTAQPVELTVEYNDPAGSNDASYGCIFDFGDGTSETVQSNSFSASVQYTYKDPGVYTVTITVTDKDGGSDVESVNQYIVVYDASEGFVTGGGWIESPEGAYIADPLLTGKANFGFVSKYKKGSNIPTGNTEFQFKTGDLNFNSYVYDWLVIAGSKAMFKGEGTINGTGKYGFMLSAVDGDLKPNGGEDMFRIKIWDGDEVVYDNQIGNADDADPTTVIGGGSIVIHSKDVKKSAPVVDPAARLNIYPNPFNNFICVDISNEMPHEIIIEMVDMYGRTVQHMYSGMIKENVEHHFELNTSLDLTPGSYVLHIRTVNGELLGREIILKH